ncbi:lipoprotein-anchoring transpeptidase ErfK/SrfK [Acidovorax soli]|uniref:Lipoprotein-anchoring transpeptidase ErfK/SrfK n=1 Tax=Acidovorax soli TaxID=592050 RepID=A0A7X0P9T0_9BURK|nr:L,D-transpeptidase [Acidovorax soli]MBB6557945.1 lipoprotein-anchoring transpeptidase ErfK/SrfK [Acidovorax soli]
MNAPQAAGVRVHVSVAQQQLGLWDGSTLLRSYPVSTALNGVGELNGSGCTPRGLHRVRAKVGAGCDAGTVFVGRRPTGERYTPELAARHPGRDWILCRILWLTGCEPGINRGGAVDTLRRYIYLHGCPDGTPLGAPASHGCVRMANADVMDLFERVAVGTPVHIVP